MDHAEAEVIMEEKQRGRGLIKPALPAGKPCKSGHQLLQPATKATKRVSVVVYVGSSLDLIPPVLLATLLRALLPTIKREHFLFVV